MEKFICPAKKKINILVVENRPEQAERLRFQLEKNQYEVIVAENGFQALKTLEVFVPKVIISEIGIPGMNGFELCRRVKKQDYRVEIPVILLTTLSEPKDVIEGFDCGADNFITRPYVEKDLLSYVDRFVRRGKPDQTGHFCTFVEVLIDGKRRLFRADQHQMLTLLIRRSQKVGLPLLLSIYNIHNHD